MLAIMRQASVSRLRPPPTTAPASGASTARGAGGIAAQLRGGGASASVVHADSFALAAVRDSAVDEEEGEDEGEDADARRERLAARERLHEQHRFLVATLRMHGAT